MTAPCVRFALSSITGPFFTRSFPYLCLCLPITFALKPASALILHHCTVLQPLQVYISERSFWIFNPLLQESWPQDIYQQITPIALIVMGGELTGYYRGKGPNTVVITMFLQLLSRSSPEHIRLFKAGHCQHYNKIKHFGKHCTNLRRLNSVSCHEETSTC